MCQDLLKLSKHLKLCLVFIVVSYLLVDIALCLSILKTQTEPTDQRKTSLDKLSQEALNYLLQTFIGIFSKNNNNNVATKDTFG